MVLQNFHFFDKNGKNLNLQYNSTLGIWEGSLFFDPISVYLFDNENLYILEKVNDDYLFPTLTSTQSISLEWDSVENSNEYFIYDVAKDTTLKNYFINKIDSKTVGYYDIYQSNLGPLNVKAPLSFNIAFNPSDEKIFTRNLSLYLNDTGSKTKLASISLYGEGIEEDERYRIWCQNFGIKFNREDANILKDYDIKEAYPDWKQVNQARKELLVNKDQIFPYVGTYKGIANYVNLLGYKDVLKIKEYWLNINPDSTYFNNFLHVDITDYLDNGKIDTFNLIYKDKSLKESYQFKKTEFLALAYQFTVATDNYDDDGIPIVEETTQFSVNEIFYKLYRLKEKLKKEFIPINVQIKDIIGEFIYFQKITISYWSDTIKIGDYDLNEDYNISYYPNTVGELFVESLDPMQRIVSQDGVDFPAVTFNQSYSNPYEFGQKYSKTQIPGMVEYIKDYYSAKISEKFPDLSMRYSWDYGDSPEKPIGCPVILSVDVEKFTCRSINGVRWVDLLPQSLSAPNYWTFENIDFRNLYEVKWIITKPNPNTYYFEYFGKLIDIHTLPHFLPHAGEYTIIAEINDFYGNVTRRQTTIVVSDGLTPQILAFSRLEDKFDFSIKNLHNVRVKDFGNAPFYFPRINLLNNEDIPIELDITKNLLEWTGFYQNSYGLGQKMYDDVEIYDSTTQQYLNYGSSQNHPYFEYWGLGKNDTPIKLSDLSDTTIDSLFFQRFCDMTYQGDFSAGFYIEDPQIGQLIQVSDYSTFTIPSFVDLDDLIYQLNESLHPAISLFSYSVLDLVTPTIVAKPRYLSKEMYQIISSDAPGVDKYSFFLPKKVYSQRTIDMLTSQSAQFDEETLFLIAPVSDLLDGDVQDPQYWIDRKFWRFDNDTQVGHLPTAIDQNAFSLEKIKVYEETFAVPENSIVFFVVNNLDGKSEFVWKLTDHITGAEIFRVRSVPFFVWKFKDIGKYSISVEVTDSKNNKYFSEVKNFVNVINKIDYVSRTEFLLNLRKNDLLKESYPR